jgi:diguanylate cyclase (GGDEF)-like protein/PAS domain S-box-containing protein
MRLLANSIVNFSGHPASMLDNPTSLDSFTPEIRALLPGLQALGTPACLISTGQCILAVNQAYLDLTGREANDVIGKRLEAIVSEPEFEAAKPHLLHALAKGSPARFSRLWKNRDGEQRWINVSYFPVHGVDGKLQVILAEVVPAIDATELDNAFIERERMLRHLADDTGRPIIYLDRDLLLRFMNKPLQDWIGNHDPNLLGKHIATLLPKKAADFYIPFVLQCLRGAPQKVETLSMVAVGPPRHIRMEFHPDIQPDGQIGGVYVVAYDIEDDYQLRQSLIVKERELRSVMDSVDMPLSKSDRGLRYLYVNRVACEWFAQGEEQIIGKHWRDIIGEQQFTETEPYALRALSGETVTYERFASFAGHASVHIRVNIFPDRNQSGEVCGVYVSITDIEQSHQQKQKIIDRERQLRLITDNIGLPISYIDADHRVRFYNKTGEEWLGLKAADVIGKTMEEAFGPDLVASAQPHIDAAFSGRTVTYDRLADIPNKGLRWMRGHLVPDAREDGTVAGIYTVLTDIHGDIVMRENLQQQERQLRLFTDNIPESIAYIDTDRRYKFVNNAFLALRGLARHEVIGRTTEEVLGHEASELAKPFVKRALAGETVIYERLVATVDAGLRWHRVRTVPDIGSDGKTQGLYVVGTDIHDIRTAHVELAGSEAELRSAMDSLPYPMAYLDRSCHYRLVNRQLEVLIGKRREEIVGRDAALILGQKRFDELKPYIDRVFAGETVSAEWLVATAGGQMRWMAMRYSPRFASDGRIIGMYTASTDIDELKRAEIELRRANWMLTSHFENSPLAVIEWDDQFHVRRWSPQAEKIFGWSQGDVLGKHFGEWRFVVEDDEPQFSAVNMRLLEDGHPRTTSLNRNYRSDGRIIWCEWYHSSLRDESGHVISILSLAQDVTTRVLAEERLIYQATHDGLTSLPNRAMLQDRMQQAISRARRGGVRVAALFIDLDRFKEVNDTLGHRIGDELLREIAERLKLALRESDFLVRLSGDEFMVVLEQLADLEPARQVAAKVLDEIRQPTSIEGHEIHVSASIGISVFPDDADDVESLLKNSDMAMYRAKALGKNSFQFFSIDLAEQGTAMRLLENSLRSALARNEFELYYQPKIAMQSGRIIGAEALLRWHHPARGLVMPGDFVRLAEEAGLMHSIGDWIIDTAFAQMRRWREAGHDNLRLAINLAATQFRATHLVERIRDRLEREKCRPDSIEIEITETSMLGDPDGVGKVLKALRELGLRVAIDDFGTGYSSLSHLKRFPIDTLKIDRTFVADMLYDREDAAIVAAVIAIARALELEVVAEGVETEAQRVLLAEQGCDAYQGYLFSRALPIAEFDAMLSRHEDAPAK